MPGRRAFTLIEMLVVVAIIGILTAILMPALGSSREAAQRLQCSQRVGQIAVAMHRHEAAHGRFPVGSRHDKSPVLHEPSGLQQAWTLPISPYLDRGDLFQNYHPEESIFAEAHQRLRETAVETLRCPSELRGASAALPTSSFAACHDDQEAPIADDSSGAFVVNRGLAPTDFRDGLSYTLFVGEKRSDPDDFGWLSGTRSTLRNTAHPLNTSFRLASERAGDVAFVGGFGSPHKGGAWFALGGGTVRFLRDEVDAQTLNHLGNRQDGGLVSDDGF